MRRDVVRRGAPRVRGEVVDVDDVPVAVARPVSGGAVGSVEHRVVVVHEHPSAPVYGYEEHRVERPRMGLRMLGFAVGCLISPVVAVWGLSMVHVLNDPWARPPWRAGSTFQVGPKLDAGKAPRHHKGGQHR